MGPSSWDRLIESMSDRVKWLHLGDPLTLASTKVEYLSVTPRQCIALAGLVDGVVTPDTFLLHAAASQRLKKRGVIVLLGSSHPSCVSYKTFHNIYFDRYDCQPCGKPYSPFDLAILPNGTVDAWPNGKPKKWQCDNVACMEAIEVSVVINAIESYILKAK